MDSDYLQYNGELTDHAPLVAAVYSQEWLSFLVGLTDVLTEPDLWLPVADRQAIIGQAQDLIVRLMGDTMQYEDLMANQHTIFFGSVNINDHAKTPVLWAQANQVFGCVWYQNVGADQDYWSIFLPMKAGLYKLDLYGMKYNNAGKTEIETVGGVIGGSLFNWYAAVATYNVVQTVDFTVVQTGIIPILIRVNGKDPASSGYYSLLTALMLRDHD